MYSQQKKVFCQNRQQMSDITVSLNTCYLRCLKPHVTTRLSIDISGIKIKLLNATVLARRFVFPSFLLQIPYMFGDIRLQFYTLLLLLKLDFFEWFGPYG